jgi:ATP-dependent 26S proteasome regulatory subunit
MAAELEAQLDADMAGEQENLDMLSNGDLRQRILGLADHMSYLRSNIAQKTHEARERKAEIKQNTERVKLNKQLPYLVANVVEIVDPYIDPNEEDWGTDASIPVDGKGVVVKTSTRQTVFLPIPGLLRAEEVVPGELVGVNKDSYIMYEKLPTEYDQRVKAMEVCCAAIPIYKCYREVAFNLITRWASRLRISNLPSFTFSMHSITFPTFYPDGREAHRELC